METSFSLSSLPEGWQHPPAEFSPAPFWFWNDQLDESELSRQLDAFQAQGIDAFVIHPRVGLPRDTGWMSQKLLDKMRFAIEEADRRGMWVVLYDEGMYPSGSSSGQVVEEDPAYQCRGLVRLNLNELQPNTMQQGIQINAEGQPYLSEFQTLIATVPYQGERYAIIQRPVDTVIRGLHFLVEDGDEDVADPPEDTPLATDLLNPQAVACFIRLVYERYYSEFGSCFGGTIQAIFTDEPMLLGRPNETGVIPGTADILDHVNDYLGYDFMSYLPALWDEAAPQSIRDDYQRAVEHRLEETYYSQLYHWCEDHHIALTGHPAEPDATRHLRYFHIPGQDIVWRQVEPDKSSALEGRQSTQAKAASSMMLHGGRRRNANEFCGAFGHELAFDEMRWLAHWLLIRGCNLLIPHAFYYSVRGARLHERPPDVGLHSPWWDNGFTEFALACRRLCWLNTDSELVCHVAILGEHHHLPWRAAKACFQHQIEFNYLDVEDLIYHTSIVENTLRIADQRYSVLIVDGEIRSDALTYLEQLADKIKIMHWTEDAVDCLSQISRQLLPQSPFTDINASGLRVRHVRKAGFDWYLLFNEEHEPINTDLRLENAHLLDPYRDDISRFDGHLSLDSHEIRVLLPRED
jgi:hypothetical protein